MEQEEEGGLGGAVDVFDQHHFMPLTASNASDESDDANSDISSLVSRRTAHLNHGMFIILLLLLV